MHNVRTQHVKDETVLVLKTAIVFSNTVLKKADFTAASPRSGGLRIMTANRNEYRNVI